MVVRAITASYVFCVPEVSTRRATYTVSSPGTVMPATAVQVWPVCVYSEVIWPVLSEGMQASVTSPAGQVAEMMPSVFCFACSRL